MPDENGVVVEKLFEVVLLVLDVKGVGQQRMPVIKYVELCRDAVLVLELFAEEQLGVKLEFEMIAAQVLHIVFYHNLDGLSC